MKQLWSKEEIEALVKENTPKRYLHTIFFQQSLQDSEQKAQFEVQIELNTPEHLTNYIEILNIAMTQGNKAFTYFAFQDEEGLHEAYSGFGVSVDEESIFVNGVIINSNDLTLSIDQFSVSKDGYTIITDEYTVKEIIN